MSKNDDPPYKGKMRVKDNSVNVQDLSDDMVKFYTELSELIGEDAEDLIVTSGHRKAGDKFSHHQEGNAMDLRANSAGEKAFYVLTNTTQGLGLLNKYKLGVLDETDPEMLKKTGGTGPHFHIGKDSTLHNKYKGRYDKALELGQEYLAENHEVPHIATKKDVVDLFRGKDFNENYRKYVQEDGENRLFIKDRDLTPKEADSNSEEIDERTDAEETKVIDEEELRNKILLDIRKEQEVERVKQQEQTENEKRLRQAEEQRLSILEGRKTQEQQKVTPQSQRVFTPPQQESYEPITYENLPDIWGFQDPK